MELGPLPWIVSSNYLYGELPRGLSQLASLQTLVADDNMLGGKLPTWLDGGGGVPLLAVLSIRNNTLQGTLPKSLKDMTSLSLLVLASNNYSGNLPDMSGLKNLQVIDLANNALQPAFPMSCEKMGLKRGPWTPEEDKILVAHIHSHGHGNWRALPKQVGLLRCGKSFRLRWINYLRPAINRGNFNDKEEQSIIQLQQLLGNR